MAHANCRSLLMEHGDRALGEAREANREFDDVELRMPEITFVAGSATLRVGKRTLQILPLPGHSPDGIGVLVVEDRVLFSGDVMMPVPYLADGDYDAMTASLKSLPRMRLENLVQGHGESILRGEVQPAVRANLAYLSAIRRNIRKAARRRDPEGFLETVGIEDCGKSRILLGGLASSLHSRNLLSLYRKWYG